MLSSKELSELADKLIFPLALFPNIFANGAKSRGCGCLAKRASFSVLNAEIQATSGLRSATFRTININPVKKTASIIPFKATFATKALVIGVIKKLITTSSINTKNKILNR
jgi:hypothetical protein